MSADAVFCSCHDPVSAQRVQRVGGPNLYVVHRSIQHGVSPLAVRGPKKDRFLVDVRMTIAKELRAEPWRLSLPAIGKALGGRNHATILSLLRGGKRKPVPVE